MAPKRRRDTATAEARTEVAGLDWRAARSALLGRLPAVPPPSGGEPADVEAPAAKAFPLCEPPQRRAGPQFVLYYRRLVGLPQLRPRPEGPAPTHADTVAAQLTCVPVATTVDLATSLLLEQSWSLQGIEIGDLASTLALAPAETLTIEVLTSQRQLLEQRVIDSTEELRSVESQVSDKEVLNVARSASRTNSWKVDGTGSFSLGGLFTLGLAGGASETLTQGAQQSQQHVQEQTTKSTHTLRTLHRVEVHGVTESLVQERMTRMLTNPYRDRTVTVNVFELQKRFAVGLAVTEVRPALHLLLQVDFGDEFVAGNSQFLKDELLDQDLAELVPLAVAAASPPANVLGITDASKNARRALALLFESRGVFPAFGPQQYQDASIDLGSPSVTFDQPWEIIRDHPDELSQILARYNAVQRSGWEVTRGNRKVFLLFLTLSSFYLAWEQLRRARLDEEQALPFARTVARSLRGLWSDVVGSTVDQVTGDDAAASRLFELLGDENAFTEALRRIPGFLALTADLAQPPADPGAGAGTQAARPDLEDFDAATDALSSVTHHLRCNAQYYTRRWLAYLVDRTGNSELAAMVADILSRDPHHQQLLRAFDPSSCYVDGEAVVVLGSPLPLDQVTQVLEGRDGGAGLPLPVPVVNDEVVPADGVHLEVAAGLCRLDEVPPPSPLVPVPVVTLPASVVAVPDPSTGLPTPAPAGPS